MTSFFVDAETGGLALPLPRAAVVPVQAWERGEDGKNRPSGRQAQDASGVPLWSLPALVYANRYGRAEPETVELLLASVTRPDEADFFPGGDA